MKNLKINTTKMLFILSILFVFSSCKKDKDEDTAKDGLGTYSFQGKTNQISAGDYRAGNGDGAWIYLTGEGYSEFVQIRFAKLGNYVIPEGSFTYKALNAIEPYNAAQNFAGGQVITAANPNGDEIIGGNVKVEKEGENYIITINATTAKGPVTGTFKGILKKI